jgi:hypothetical protein
LLWKLGSLPPENDALPSTCGKRRERVMVTWARAALMRHYRNQQTK